MKHDVFLILKQLYALSPWFILGLFCLVMFACFALFWFIKRIVYPDDGKTTVFGDDIEVWPYQPLDIMTNSEVRFFKLLQTALNHEFFIFSQVQLSRIIDAKDDEDSEKWLNRINRMSVDYLIVAEDAQTPLLVIELDDWSHAQKRRQRADAKKDKALTCAGIPILRFHGESMPTLFELRETIMDTIHRHYEFVETDQ